MPLTFAITGITGHVGGHVADFLLAAGHKVRGIVRDDKSKSSEGLKAKGVELVVADFENVSALTAAFTGADGVFILSPPYKHHPEPVTATKLLAQNARDAVVASKVPHVVLLSAIGAHIEYGAITGPIIRAHNLEEAFKPVASPTLSVTAVRAGWFAENNLGSIAYSKVSNTYNIFNNPNTELPVTATIDIGEEISKILTDQTSYKGYTIVDLQGPETLTYNDMANIFFKLSGKSLPVIQLTEEGIIGLVKSVGGSEANGQLIANMSLSYDKKQIQFEDGPDHIKSKGKTTYEQFLKNVLQSN